MPKSYIRNRDVVLMKSVYGGYDSAAGITGHNVYTRAQNCKPIEFYPACILNREAKI
jgi:hypothetical protein